MFQIVKNAGINLIATIINLFCGLVASVIISRVLGPSDYGLYSLVLWLLPTLVLFLDPGMSSATAKFVSELEGTQQRGVANSLTLIFVVLQGSLGIITGFVLITHSSLVTKLLGNNLVKPYLLILGLSLPIVMLATVLRGRLVGFQRYGLIGFVTSISSFITLICAVALLGGYFRVKGLIFLIIGIYPIQMVLYAYFVWREYKIKPLERIPTLIRSRVIWYCVGVFIITSYDSIVWQRSETFFLSRYSSTAQIAYYGLAYSIASMLATTLPAAFIRGLMPAFSIRYGANKREEMQKLYSLATRYAGLIAFPISFGGIAISRSLILLIYGAEYVSAVIPLQILFFAGAFGTVAIPGSALFLALGKPYKAALWGIPIAILNIGLGFTLVPGFGASGAAIANTTSQLLGVIASVIFLVYFQKFIFPLRSLVKSFMAASIVAGCAYLIINQLTGWIGLFLSVAVATVLYIPMLILTRSIEPGDFLILRELTNLFPNKIITSVKYLLDFLESINNSPVSHLKP